MRSANHESEQLDSDGLPIDPRTNLSQTYGSSGKIGSNSERCITKHPYSDADKLQCGLVTHKDASQAIFGMKSEESKIAPPSASYEGSMNSSRSERLSKTVNKSRDVPNATYCKTQQSNEVGSFKNFADKRATSGKYLNPVVLSLQKNLFEDRESVGRMEEAPKQNTAEKNRFRYDRDEQKECTRPSMSVSHSKRVGG